MERESVTPESDYVRPGDAARYLHVSPKTINRWANDGKIPCVLTLGGHRRFRREDIDAAVRRMAALGADFNIGDSGRLAPRGP